MREQSAEESVPGINHQVTSPPTGAQPRRRSPLSEQHAGGISWPNLLPDEAAETQLSQLMNAGKNNKLGCE